VLAGWTPGVHLNDTGRAQAGALAERLADIPFAAIVTSPLERCRETIAPAARQAGVRVKVDRRLGEVGYGDWTGAPLPKLAKTRLWRVVQYRPSLARFPGGETLLSAQTRIVAAIEDLREATTGNVLLCSHADMIKLALAHYAGMHMDEYQRIVVAPASISVLRFDERSVQVERMNDTGSFDDLRRASKAAKEWGHA
jgi:probable phosphomutase (TIGR03848 family)